MKIRKVINHNMVSAITEQGQEVIAMGKGIGFQKKANDSIPKHKVEKIFRLEDQKLYHKFVKLVDEVPGDIVHLTDDFISLAKRTLKKELNESLYITLPDHINQALIRIKKGHTIKNALLWDIKKLYKEEFEVSMKALTMVKDRLQIELPEDEAGFITFHLVNAELNDKVKNVMSITKLMKDILSIVKYHYQVELDENSLNYYRFITHLKFFTQRLVHKEPRSTMNNPLYEVLQTTYPKAFNCVAKIEQHIQTKYDSAMSVDDKVYLIIHIERIVSHEQTTT
ncbi:PRD domain-containing protein [Alkalicoccobacillus gibsonii]|uniref:PRD domain-containing protein n=1 Tax=Alkalicoccobacillus gibsonii TaxID=79881 RepID=A0ABU9VDV1_9BACI